jgi:MOSC N-terminal beta barrel domain
MGSTRSLAASDPGCAVEAGPAAKAKRLVGTIEELWRYPVKSMLGGTVSELLVTEQGGLGDRAWALRDQRNGRIVSAKRVPRLLEFRATYEVEPTPESAGVVRIETPDGIPFTPGRKMFRHVFRALSAARWFSITSHDPMRRQASTGGKYSEMV